MFVERLWHTVIYEEIYVKAYETPADLRRGLDRFFMFYNRRRRHTSLDRNTPDNVYFNQLTLPNAA